jgi:periplasmic divalent cation tolerance protein
MKTIMGVITCPNKKEAEAIARHLLEEKLIACANIVQGIESLYWWKGKIEEAKEALLVVKTGEKLKEKIIEEVEKAHSYELPVIEFVETKVNSKAREWIERWCKNKK